MIKVGLILPIRRTWRGGVNYFHNLLGCYKAYPDAEVKLEVLTDCPEDVAEYRCNSIEIHACPEARMLSLRSPINWPRRLAIKALAYDPVLFRIAERLQLDILTHNSLGRQETINTLFWQPDLQHKVFPEFFRASECASRDVAIANVRLWGNILFSSQATADDFRHYYPELASVQTHILHFPGAGVLRIAPCGREELDAQYPTGEPYFFLPNQFWKHKNHEVVVEALRRTPSEIRVICTGAMQDPRDPAYVPALLDKVKKAGLEHRFACLGTVPYGMLVSLMHHSIAVLQPSLFEGWSTSVEESKAMCKQIILSNIDVHLEQAPERGVYFSPDAPEELAECMKQAFETREPAIEQRFVERRMSNKIMLERTWIEDYGRILRTVVMSPCHAEN